MGEYIPAIILTPLEIVYNKYHLSSLLHVTDSNIQKGSILLLQKVKEDIINSRTQDNKKNCNCAY
jgi:hypothetical protein